MRWLTVIVLGSGLGFLSACSGSQNESRAAGPESGKVTAQPAAPDSRPSTPESSPKRLADREALAIFKRRILPIMKSPNPSSCAECHLSGVDLKDYVGEDQASTFAALRKRGLIDIDSPDDSKILAFIARKPRQPSLITEKVRQQEYQAFRAWIHAAVQDPKLLKAGDTAEPFGAQLPVEVIRHARKDRVLASFIDNVWTEVARCSGCHSPRFNQKQVKEHGERVSWIRPDDPEATLKHMVEAGIVNVEFPEESLLLKKPTLQVKHGGGRKLVVGDRTYKQFRRFIDDYVATVKGQYKSADELPQPDDEVSVATSMRDGIWLKLTDVPARFGDKLLAVDLYRREGNGWSKTRWAAADRLVAGDRHLWQQTLSLTARRGSPRAEEISRHRSLPPGEYLIKIFVDQTDKLQHDPKAELTESDVVGQTTVTSRWPGGYGSMTVVKFPAR